MSLQKEILNFALFTKLPSLHPSPSSVFPLTSWRRRDDAGVAGHAPPSPAKPASPSPVPPRCFSTSPRGAVSLRARRGRPLEAPRRQRVVLCAPSPSYLCPRSSPSPLAREARVLDLPLHSLPIPEPNRALSGTQERRRREPWSPPLSSSPWSPLLRPSSPKIDPLSSFPGLHWSSLTPPPPPSHTGVPLPASMNAGEPLLAVAPPVRSPLAQIEYSTTFLASP